MFYPSMVRVTFWECEARVYIKNGTYQQEKNTFMYKDRIQKFVLPVTTKECWEGFSQQ